MVGDALKTVAQLATLGDRCSAVDVSLHPDGTLARCALILREPPGAPMPASDPEPEESFRLVRRSDQP